MKRNRKALRRLSSGAGLIFVSCSLLACGSDDDALSAPNPPEAPVDQGQAPTAGCTDGTLASGALYRICFPAEWNGDLVLFAHGYVAPQQPLAIPDENVGGEAASTLLTGLGYAYATTSYRANGLVAPDAVDDLVELQDTVRLRYRPDPARTALVGFSEGGLVAALALERHADRFAGALAGCGPLGDFQAQLNYLDDFRVVFDYFFPRLLPGDAVDVPPSLRERWEEIYVPTIVLALAARPDAGRQLLNVTGAPAAGTDLRSVAETTIGLLWYNVFGTADAQQRIGGQPYDNSRRVYAGSSDDAALNAEVDRFSADPSAATGLARFATSGKLTAPLVDLHTTGDPIVPVRQSQLYSDKVSEAGSGSEFTYLEIERFGHCTFEKEELLSAFAQLWQKIGPGPSAASVLATR